MDEEKKQKYMQFKAMQEQIEQTSQQLEVLNEQLSELELSKDALEELKKTPKDNEILASIAPGIFIKANLKDNKNLIVNVGADVTMEKTIPQVIKMINQQKNSMEKNLAQSDMLLQVLTQQALELYREFE